MAAWSIRVDTKIAISLKHDSPREAATRDALIALLERHDLTRWLFTRTVVIDEASIPHTHPVLTLHARHAAQEDLLLSTFVHEQLHWHLSSKRGATQRAIAEIRALWPDAPTGFPAGAQDLASTYLHVVVNELEWRSTESLIGEERAAAVMTFWCTDHYRAIYRFVMENRHRVAAIVDAHDLAPS
jgi:hypothetical protein